jgi:hypothetical protein
MAMGHEIGFCYLTWDETNFYVKSLCSLQNKQMFCLSCSCALALMLLQVVVRVVRLCVEKVSNSKRSREL